MSISEKTPSYDDLGRGIYVITADDGEPCKVGITNNLSSRLCEIQIGNWNRLRPSFFSFVVGDNIRRQLNMWSAFSNSAATLEAKVHRQLREFDLGLSGERFDIGEADCVAVIKKVAQQNGFRLAGPEMLQSIHLYRSLPSRQMAYVQAMVAAEQSAQRAFLAARAVRLTA